ncbi:malto-oligosyltrehalose synthase [Pseudomonas lundensis]|uniref:malto-oligosyltrehalose synthase n=1 Tax=Pseudomonas lundensis TaxID=86185 RepID=UPI000BA2938B|nr:malto-oligosyltrehalose synthase [Pseudomonas lundensis]OZY50498.1 malto-oligosyltrehalose synthase [Pseudomonas lundensis]
MHTLSTPILRATQRLQFHAGFTLDDARLQVPYFARMGISHLYASPLLTARDGSMHGYDVVDPTRVSPALGGEAALRRLVAELRAHDMGLILDVVSNHMAVGGADNPWWLDLLAWGRASPYAEFFDIQWHSPDPLLEGQLLLPFLGNDYGATLKAGELPLRYDAQQGRFYTEHGHHHFPICPLDYGFLLHISGQPDLQFLGERFTALHPLPHPRERTAPLHAELAALSARPEVLAAIEQQLTCFDARHPSGLERLHALLERQSYRLASWRTAADDINWRRFFDVNELAGLRVERPRVFEATHQKIFDLIRDGLVDGLRIDHVDGLADPRGYCRKLRRRVDALAPDRHLPIYVEKILGAEESLPDDWHVDGTTGYEFMDQVSLLQHDPAGAAPLASLWAEHSERPGDFREQALLARQQILNGSLAGDCDRVALALRDVARDDLMTRDLTLGAITRALQALVVHFSVYRTYINAAGRSAADDEVFGRAMEGARNDLSEADWPVLESLQRWLGGDNWRTRPYGRSRKLLKRACVRFQQLTSPTAAKAVEDTAFYRYGALLSRNDVGFDAERFSAPAQVFHQTCAERLLHFPDTLLATATHDHKRGEDCRARLAVISEKSADYARCIARWRPMASTLRGHREGPSAGDELLLYQILLSTWPLTLSPDDPHGLAHYNERVWQWQLKALREAKLDTQWAAPNEAYEQAVQAFIEQLLLHPQGAALRAEIHAFSEQLAPAGALNSLVQCVLKLTTPGVPDLYQGTEFWDFSLVDPDNRRPVDFALRQQQLDIHAPAPALLDDWRSGAIKQAVIARTLAMRAEHPVLFARGRYQPLHVTGPHADRVLAFAREWQGQWVVVVAPRLSAPLLQNNALPLINPREWADTRLELPFDGTEHKLNGLFAHPVVTNNKAIRVSDALGSFPVNLMITT